MPEKRGIIGDRADLIRVVGVELFARLPLGSNHCGCRVCSEWGIRRVDDLIAAQACGGSVHGRDVGCRKGRLLEQDGHGCHVGKSG